MLRYRLLLVNGLLALTLLGVVWGRRVESAPYAKGDFFRPLQLPFRGWKTTDVPLTAAEREMLEPDSSLARRYESPEGDLVELVVIAGHQKKTVHTPGFCMAGSGWERLDERERTLTVDGQRLPVVQSLISKERQQVLATYFFTDGQFSTRSLVRFQGEHLLRRMQGGMPVGSLVRILVWVKRGRPEAEEVTEKFAQATLPAVLRELRQAQ